MNGVAVITTGGTIGSLLGTDKIAIDPGGEALQARLKAMAQETGVDIRLFPAANMGSSNFEPEDWIGFVAQIEACMADGFDRIVLTHGTDTLHFTAAFLALLFHDRPVTLCLTGAFYPLGHPDSDADRNVRAALRAAIEPTLQRGVYTAFYDPDCEGPGVIPATDLVPPRFDEDRFRTLYSGLPEVTHSVAEAHSIFTKIEWGALSPEVTADGLRNAKTRIASALLFPGIDMRLYDALPQGGVLLIEGYHSGTATVREGETGLLALHRRRPDLTIGLISVPSPNVPIPYEESVTLKQAGILVYRDLPLHLLLAAELIGLAQGKSGREAVAAFDAYLI
ncbi:hypothetical protein GCM10023219_10890 [Stakelama sediminis]|uniref:L-asparaginase N-terminal domain-containing protein n=1 Tax=Stakelama sediminis TaxID=463200 RepID=A0A840YVZ9_9SPHN|nr:asparaginase [Stakelama sediminis]MBB5717813.1 hypothetical protein [Stakelama sediminis]